MKINTHYTGEVEYKEKDIIFFEESIIGFEEYKKFIIVKNADEGLPFDWLQSIEEERISFIITNPSFFTKEYDFKISNKVINKLQIESENDLSIASLTVIPDNIKETTINLKSPILINTKNKKACQFVVDEDYPYKYKIFNK